MAEAFVTHLEPIGWSCPNCTYINFPSRPGCEMCAGDRPVDYQPPSYPYHKTPQQLEWEKTTNHYQAIFDQLQLTDGQEEPVDMIIEHRPMNGPVNQNEEEQLQDEVDATDGQKVSDDWREVIELDNEPLTINQEAGECSVCLEVVEMRQGIKLKECFHIFCRSCLQEHIDHSTDPDIQCPQCPSPIQEREIRALVNEEAFLRYQVRCVTQAEASATEPTFHCQTPNCPGWCYYDENVDVFRCFMCGARNCINCRAIHDGVDCMMYQQQLAEMAENDEKAKKTQEYFDELITKGEAMLCPRCTIIITKKGGCDWLCCPVCRVEICWVTKGPRWGPRVYSHCQRIIEFIN